MNFDYAIHSDFLIYWTGKDFDSVYDKQWYESDKSKTNKNCDITDLYIKRLYDILKYGLWMTEEKESVLCFDGENIYIPTTPKTCFTELKVSESRKHARRYGRLGIGVKRPFVFKRFGRPIVYYGPRNDLKNDHFLKSCSKELSNKDLLNFFKPMNSSNTLNYDLYGESEWRIVYFKELFEKKLERLIIDPRDDKNTEEHDYFCKLKPEKQEKLKYLIPLDAWFGMIIYPSLDVKNKAQQDDSIGLKEQIRIIKGRGAIVEERNNWPIEVDLDACRNF